MQIINESTLKRSIFVPCALLQRIVCSKACLSLFRICFGVINVGGFFLWFFLLGFFF